MYLFWICLIFSSYSPFIFVICCQLDDEGREFLKELAEIRAGLLSLFPYSDGASHDAPHLPDGKKKGNIKINAEDVLVAEVRI